VLQGFALYDEAAATNERGWKAFAEPVLALRGLIAAPVSHGLLQQHQHCSLLFPITVLLQSVLFGIQRMYSIRTSIVWESISIFHGTNVTSQGLDTEGITAELHAYDRHIHRQLCLQKLLVTSNVNRKGEAC